MTFRLKEAVAGWPTPLSAVHAYDPASLLPTLVRRRVTPPPGSFLPSRSLPEWLHVTEGAGWPLARHLTATVAPWSLGEKNVKNVMYLESELCWYIFFTYVQKKTVDSIRHRQVMCFNWRFQVLYIWVGISNFVKLEAPFPFVTNMFYCPGCFAS